VETERNEGSLAAEAAARVQAIVAAAETSAQQLRDDAERDAAELVERVAAAARGLLERIEELSLEVDRLREGAAGLTGSLDELRRQAAALGGPAVQPPAPVEAPDGGRSTDEVGARLVALNMALEGTPRDATARYLAEQFELPGLDALLDDVYASAGK
jgi:hypothetical protein